MMGVIQTEEQKMLFRMRRTHNGLSKTVYIVGTLCVFAYLNRYIELTPTGLSPLQQTLWFVSLFIATQLVAGVLALLTGVLMTAVQLFPAVWKGSMEEKKRQLGSYDAEIRRQRAKGRKKSKKMAYGMLLSNLVLCLGAYRGWDTLVISALAALLVFVNIYYSDLEFRNVR